LPVSAYELLRRICDEQWLCSYGNLSGITQTLDRMGRRFRKPTALGGAISVLISNEADLRSDFNDFFPSLTAHLERNRLLTCESHNRVPCHELSPPPSSQTDY
jgi:acyl carrier protein phosphodiesterase